MNKFVMVCIILICITLISTLIMWGVGNLIIWVFHINYNWTFWHGLASCFIYWILRGIFNSRNEK